MEIQLNRTYGKTNKDKISCFKVVILWMKVETYNLSPQEHFLFKPSIFNLMVGFMANAYEICV